MAISFVLSVPELRTSSVDDATEALRCVVVADHGVIASLFADLIVSFLAPYVVDKFGRFS